MQRLSVPSPLFYVFLGVGRPDWAAVLNKRSNQSLVGTLLDNCWAVVHVTSQEPKEPLGLSTHLADVCVPLELTVQYDTQVCDVIGGLEVLAIHGVLVMGDVLPGQCGS